MSQGVLSGKVAIVTGAGSTIGMGRSMSMALAAAGARVAMMDINREALERSASDAREAGGDDAVLPIVADVTDPADAERVVRETVARFGGLDILVNNAGTNQRNVGGSTTIQERAWNVTPDAWARVLAVNFSGPFFMARAALAHMLPRGQGRIIGVTTSLDTMIKAGFSPYGPSKAGHEALMSVMAQELEGSGVTCNILVPGGPVNTNLLPPDTPFDRAKLIQPDVMGRPVVWLASDASAAVNGKRLIAYFWDERQPLTERLERCAGPIAWPQLGSQAVYPE